VANQTIHLEAARTRFHFDLMFSLAQFESERHRSVIRGSATDPVPPARPIRITQAQLCAVINLYQTFMLAPALRMIAAHTKLQIPASGRTQAHRIGHAA
jgi:hypothetical protein